MDVQVWGLMAVFDLILRTVKYMCSLRKGLFVIKLRAGSLFANAIPLCFIYLFFCLPTFMHKLHHCGRFWLPALLRICGCRILVKEKVQLYCVWACVHCSFVGLFALLLQGSVKSKTTCMLCFFLLLKFIRTVKIKVNIKFTAAFNLPSD